MRPKSLRLLLLAVLVTATVGAGIFDIAFNDVIPARPYSHIFSLTPVWLIVGRDSSILSQVMIIGLVLFVIASLVRQVANVTTGITIAHTGFTPNVNITGSPGVSSVLTVYPLVFVFLGLVYLVKHFHAESRGL